MRAHSRLIVIAAAVAVALGASGCVDGSPAPTSSATTPATTPPTSTPTPAVSPTATPTPTPTPDAAEYDPADMATWQITYSGIGPVQLDEPVDELLAEIPGGESCRPGVAGFFDYGVVGVGDGSDPSLVVAVSTGPSTAVDFADRPHTDAGLGAGSTFDELLTAYPAAEEFTDSQGRPGYRLTDGTSWILFTSVDGETINIIDVSRHDQDVKEYCG